MSGHGYSAMASDQTSTLSLPLWDRNNPDADDLVYFSDEKMVFLRTKPKLQKYLQLADMWAYLISLDVIQTNEKDEFTHSGADAIVCERLLDHLMRCPKWKLHGFARALAKTDQDHIIPFLGLNPEAYWDHNNGRSIPTRSSVLWDRHNPDQQEIVAESQRYRDLLKQNLVSLTYTLKLSTELFAYLKQYEIINDAGLNRIRHNSTDEDAVHKLVRHLECGPTWKLHGFFRALVESQNECILTNLGLNIVDYQDPPSPSVMAPSVDSEGGESQQHETKASDVPDEVLTLSPEFQDAYKAACEGGTHMVYQCRVMLVGHAGAGKTNIINTLLDRGFQKDHIITNGMDVEINKTKNWHPHKAENEFKEMLTDFMIDNVNLQRKKAEEEALANTSSTVQEHLEDEGRAGTTEDIRIEGDETHEFDVNTHKGNTDGTRLEIPDDIKLMIGDKLSEQPDSNATGEGQLSLADQNETVKQEAPEDRAATVQDQLEGGVRAGTVQDQLEGGVRAGTVQDQLEGGVRAGTVQDQLEGGVRAGTVEDSTIDGEQVRPPFEENNEVDVKAHKQNADETRVQIQDEIASKTHKKCSKRLDTGKGELFFWDSGGQGLFYNTTKTFLTRRCVYIIAMDMTKGLDETILSTRKNRNGEDIPDTGCPQTVKEHLEYWFSCIHTFLPKDNSQGNVIIVGTHKDKCTAESETQYRKSIAEFLKGKPYEHQCCGIYTLSNQNRNNTDVLELKAKILEVADTQAYAVPLSWFNFKEKLLQPFHGTVPMRNWTGVTDLGHEFGMTEEKDVCAALSFLHEVGDIIFFNESSLRDFIITNPRWLIKQITKVITLPDCQQPDSTLPENLMGHRRTLDEKGILHQELLKDIWRDDNERKWLVFLMMKFALLLPIFPRNANTAGTDNEATHYLVPCLLPLVDPDTFITSGQGLTAPPVMLVPPNEFIPVGLTNRLFAGLVNEDGWDFFDVNNEEQVYINAAQFLPKDSGVKITILQKPSFIEVFGEKTAEDETMAEFAVPLKNILYRLDAITSSICPLQGFKLKIHCLDCIEWGSKYQLGYTGERVWSNTKAGKGNRNPESRIENLTDFMSCPQEEHKQRCPIWFRQEGSIRGNTTDLITMADSIRTELAQDLPRLLHPSGPGASLSVMFTAHIRSLKILTESEIQEIEAAQTKMRKVDVLVKSLLSCCRKNLVLFAWVLVTFNQGHQLPESIKKNVRIMLRSYNMDEIRQQAEEVDDSGEEAVDDRWSRHRSHILNQLQDWLDLQDGSLSNGPWSRQDVERDLRLESTANTVIGHLAMVTNVHLKQDIRLQPPPKGLVRLLEPNLPKSLLNERYDMKVTKANIKQVDKRNMTLNAEIKVTFLLSPN